MCAKSQMYVLLEVGAPLSLVDAELDRVGDYDCLVDVLYTSVCGTQVGEIRGTRGPDQFLPHCMGHEGLGIVRSIGNKVSRFLVGDLVYLTWIPCDDSPVTGKRHGVTRPAISLTVARSSLSQHRLCAHRVGYLRCLRAFLVMIFRMRL